MTATAVSRAPTAIDHHATTPQREARSRSSSSCWRSPCGGLAGQAGSGIGTRGPIIGMKVVVPEGKPARISLVTGFRAPAADLVMRQDSVARSGRKGEPVTGLVRRILAAHRRPHEIFVSTRRAM